MRGSESQVLFRAVLYMICESTHSTVTHTHDWRIIVFFVGALLVGGSGLAQQLPVPVPQRVGVLNAAREIPARPLPANVPDGFSVAAVGDLIIAFPATPSTNPGFAAVERLLQGADVAFGNFEGSLVDPEKLKVWVAAETGGGDEYGPPAIAADLRKMGFDLLSHANNHSTDWGIPGMEATDRVLTQAGLVHAGTGLNLAQARAPRYLATPSGRVALVAMTSSFTPMELAGAPFRGVAERPGVNILRTTLFNVVSRQQMSWLRNIYNGQAHKPLHPIGPDVKQLDLSGVHYCVGTTHCADMPGHNVAGTAPGLTYKMNADDLDAILRNIREGKEESNFEIVCIHAHNPGNWSAQPAEFMPTLAHDAINAGADEFVASGPHRLRGIEIYKGKPIFYSLGDFFYEVMHRVYLDADNLERAHLNMATTTDYEYQQSRVGASPAYQFQSVVAVSVFDAAGTLKEVKLYPIEEGYQRTPRADAGVPYLAGPAVAQQILKRLQRLSKPFGTRIAIQGNVGVIRITPGK